MYRVSSSSTLIVGLSYAAGTLRRVAQPSAARLAHNVSPPYTVPAEDSCRTRFPKNSSRTLIGSSQVTNDDD